MIYIGVEFRLKASGAQQISPQITALQSNRKNTLMLDIRKEEAYLSGHIQGSHHCSADDLKNLRQLKTLSPTQKKNLLTHTVILIDAQGAQAGKAVKVLRQQGFETLKMLQGGIASWQQEKLPLVKSSAPHVDSDEEALAQNDREKPKPKKSKSKSKAKLQLLPSKED
jgi:rhodanese-related sulfurtransferase